MNADQTRYDRLGFLAMNRTEPGDGYVGALLVTDLAGVPLEFRATHPVKPTAIQRTLYGTTLEPHIGITLCGRQLLRTSERPPDLLFVNREFMVDLREEFPNPVVFCRGAGELVEVADGVDRLPSTRVDPLTAGISPIVVSVHGMDIDKLDNLRGHIEKLTASLDILEPFGRIAEALKVLGKQDKRFQ